MRVITNYDDNSQHDDDYASDGTVGEAIAGSRRLRGRSECLHFRSSKASTFKTIRIALQEEEKNSIASSHTIVAIIVTFFTLQESKVTCSMHLAEIIQRKVDRQVILDNLKRNIGSESLLLW